MRILFTGGGSGGHITPIVAVIRELKNIADREQILDLELYYMGPLEFGQDMLKEEGIAIIPVLSGKLRTYFSFKNFLDVFRIAAGIGQALWNLFLVMPDVIFSKGGYGALPAVIGSFIWRIPLIIHDSDAVPGKINKFAARFAARIGVAFASAADFFPKEKTALVGVPIRKRIFGGDRKEAREELGIFSDRPVVGIIGASQGSQKINEAVLGVVKELASSYEVLHQTGEKNYRAVREEASVILEYGAQDRYHPFGFLEEGKLRSFYASSDLIVARAGATTIFEIAAWGKPSILIPLEIAAQDHQRKNAYEYASGGAAVVIEEANLTPHILLAEIKKVLGSPELMRKMSEQAQRFARIDSGEIIAREILKLGIH